VDNIKIEGDQDVNINIWTKLHKEGKEGEHKVRIVTDSGVFFFLPL
jgi:hypothetical protein